MTKEKPNEDIELARQSGYNEACFVYENRVKKLKKDFDPDILLKRFDISTTETSTVDEEIDKIMGEFK